MSVLVVETDYSCLLVDLLKLFVLCNNSPRYASTVIVKFTLCVVTTSLYSMKRLIGSQCKDLSDDCEGGHCTMMLQCSIPLELFNKIDIKVIVCVFTL